MQGPRSLLDRQALLSFPTQPINNHVCAMKTQKDRVRRTSRQPNMWGFLEGAASSREDTQTTRPFPHSSPYTALHMHLL